MVSVLKWKCVTLSSNLFTHDKQLLQNVNFRPENDTLGKDKHKTGVIMAQPILKALFLQVKRQGKKKVVQTVLKYAYFESHTQPNSIKT